MGLKILSTFAKLKQIACNGHGTVNFKCNYGHQTEHIFKPISDSAKVTLHYRQHVNWVYQVTSAPRSITHNMSLHFVGSIQTAALQNYAPCIFQSVQKLACSVKP